MKGSDPKDIFELAIAAIVVVGSILVSIVQHFRGKTDEPIALEEKPAGPPAPPKRNPQSKPPSAPRSQRPGEPRGYTSPPVRRPATQRPRPVPVKVVEGAPSDSALAPSLVTKTSADAQNKAPGRIESSVAAAHRSKDRFALIRHPTRSTLRYAILMGEILGPPVSLRPPIST